VILSRQTRALHHAERVQLLATLRTLGPDAPTLCEGWPVRTLVAHLVVSEQQAGLPLAFSYPVWRVAPARVTGALLKSLDKPGTRLMNRAEARGWEWMLGRLEAGPPRVYALRLIAEVRLLEEWIHHEDIRRANGEGPRPLDPRLADRLLAGMLAMSRFRFFAKPREGIEVTLPGGTRYDVGDGPTRTRVSGDVGEVALWLAGRGRATVGVDVGGDVPATALLV
jgi:uncharacterized protein (TIGR03085 family)